MLDETKLSFVYSLAKYCAKRLTSERALAQTNTVGYARLPNKHLIWVHDHLPSKPVSHRLDPDVSFIAQTLNTQPGTVKSDSESVMTSHSIGSFSVSTICVHVRCLGCAISSRIRLYDEEFEVVSDPFPAASGIAVHVTTKEDQNIAYCRFP